MVDMQLLYADLLGRATPDRPPQPPQNEAMEHQGHWNGKRRNHVTAAVIALALRIYWLSLVFE